MFLVGEVISRFRNEFLNDVTNVVITLALCCKQGHKITVIKILGIKKFPFFRSYRVKSFKELRNSECRSRICSLCQGDVYYLIV